ncbi:hypothetical protein DFH09DRAFT_1089159 [Mycena vulgaris]|nr:hypothetical protein DFH09DRAFT_1089159 [Mycena vulgaris]
MCRTTSPSSPPLQPCGNQRARTHRLEHSYGSFGVPCAALVLAVSWQGRRQVFADSAGYCRAAARNSGSVAASPRTHVVPWQVLRTASAPHLHIGSISRAVPRLPDPFSEHALRGVAWRPVRAVLRARPLRCEAPPVFTARARVDLRTSRRTGTSANLHLTAVARGASRDRRCDLVWMTVPASGHARTGNCGDQRATTDLPLEICRLADFLCLPGVILPHYAPKSGSPREPSCPLEQKCGNIGEEIFAPNRSERGNGLVALTTIISNAEACLYSSSPHWSGTSSRVLFSGGESTIFSGNNSGNKGQGAETRQRAMRWHGDVRLQYFGMDIAVLPGVRLWDRVPHSACGWRLCTSKRSALLREGTDPTFIIVLGVALALATREW